MHMPPRDERKELSRADNRGRLQKVRFGRRGRVVRARAWIVVAATFLTTFTVFGVVYSFGAVDDVPRLLDALGDPKHPDVREAAVEALRAWIGRGPGFDMKLYTFLVEQRKFSAGQAEIVMLAA